MNNYIKLSIKGKNPNYFVKELIKRKINIYEIEVKDLEIIIKVNYKDYEKILEIKTTYKIKEIERIGINKYLVKRNLIFVICFILGIFIEIGLSKIIFNIEIVHSNREIVEMVKNDLEYEGIKKYNFKVSYKKKEEIIKKILKKEKDDLEWLEIEEVGTKYIVKIEQRKKNKIEKICSPRNIVAKKEAMILSIRATEGEIVTKKYDYVAKDDVLISGLIYNKEKIVGRRCARGVVFGEVWYKVKIELPKQYREEEKTGKSSYGIQIRFLNKKIDILKKYKTSKDNKIKIISNKIIPFDVSFAQYLETKVTKKNYNKNNVVKDALKIAEDKILNKIGKEDIILSKKVLKKEENNSKIYVEVFVKVKEDITAYKNITKKEIEKIEKEQEEINN